MISCKVTINKNNQLTLKDIDNKKEFIDQIKEDNQVMILSKKEYDSLIASGHSEDNVKLSETDVNVTYDVDLTMKLKDLESQLLLNGKDIEYKDIKIEELQNTIESLESDISIFERDKEEMKQTNNQNILLQNDLKHLESKLADAISDKEKYVTLCNLLMNRTLWQRIQNTIPSDK